MQPDELFCAIFNDPMVRSFGAEHVHVPLGMKFLAAHVLSNTCKRKSSQVVKGKGSCDVRVYAWGGRRKGKTFLKGMEVKIMVTTDKGLYHHAMRVYGEARYGEYKFIENGNKFAFGSGQYGWPVQTDIPNYGFIRTEYDNVHNIAILNVAMCGMVVALRPAELEEDPLLLPSGMFISVTEPCGVKYLSTAQSLCSPPPGEGPSLEDQAAELSARAGLRVSIKTLALYKVITSDITQNFPGASPFHIMMSETAKTCDLEILLPALDQCGFILQHPLTFNCIDNTTDMQKAVYLIDECFFAYCESNSLLCKEVQNNIRTSGCAGKVPKHELTIMNHTCDFNY